MAYNGRAIDKIALRPTSRSVRAPTKVGRFLLDALVYRALVLAPIDKGAPEDKL